MYIGNLMLLGLNLPLINIWVRLLKVPYHYMAVMIIIICTIGAYSIKNSIFDVGTMIVFGVLGYVLRKGGFPAAPLVLALILGKMFEHSVQQALKTSGADPMIFIDKPISAMLLSVGLLVMLLPVFKWVWMRLLVARK
jgi:putative tricarboxylic transport membrane protein